MFLFTSTIPPEEFEDIVKNAFFSQFCEIPFLVLNFHTELTLTHTY